MVLVGAVVTAAAAWGVVADKGVYFTRTEVVFLAPTSSENPNALRTQSDDVIMTAGLVAKRMMGADNVTKFASPDVTLIGLGVRDGWMIRLPDTGGQWASNFATQRLILDIVGPTEAAVKRQQDQLTQRIDDELYALHREQSVDPINDITAIVAPETTIIFHVGSSRQRALGMTAVLGGGATVAAVILLEYRRRRAVATASVGSNAVTRAAPALVE
ncbi:hypothetical protein GCM10022382_31360 [Microbacterium invictum]